MLRGIAPPLAAAALASLLGLAAPDPDAAVAVEGPGTVAEAAPVRDLPFFYDLYTFRGARGRTTVVAAFAVPVGELEDERRDGAVRYRFDVSLVLSDTAVGSVDRTDDSVFVRVPRRLHPEHLLHTHIEVAVPPSPAMLQRVIMTDATTPGIGQLYGSDFVIPDYGGDRLMLSDIALGKPGARAGWRRGDVTLALLPTSQFPESSFEVYYEIYNLPSGARYSTDIAIERLSGDDDEGIRLGEPVHLRFSGESQARPDGTAAELRLVQASLERGRYRLTVTVTNDETGERAVRVRPFEVRGWKQETTLVSALPIR